MSDNDSVSPRDKSPSEGESKSGGSGGCGGMIAFFISAMLFRACAGGKTEKPTPVHNNPPVVTSSPTYATVPPAAYTPPMPPASFLPPAATTRIHVTGRDGTAELAQLTGGMSAGEALALGLGVLLTGTDTYAARIRISNTGTVPVWVYPENIHVHFGGASAGVTSVSHPRFLQRGLLRPGYYFEGLVAYRARIDIGAAMRLAGGSLSYDDYTIQVTYDP
jgi:hypothetical protein